VHKVRSADGILLFCVVIWGFNFTVMKYALRHGFEPMAFTAPRFGLATLAFLTLTYTRERNVKTTRRDLLIMLGTGAFGIALNQITFIFALRQTTASTMALVVATMPVFASLISRERHGSRHWIATLMSFGGVALIAIGAGGGLSGNLGGILLGLVAPITWAAYSTILQPLLTRLSAVRVNAITCFAACIPLFIVGAPSLASEEWGKLSGTLWAALVFSSLGAFALTNVLWFVVINRVGTARASIYVNLQPFLGALFAVLLLSETLSGLQIAGGVVIGAGIVLGRWRASLEPPAE
jgi:drug/metabolite transporter (DMT)-like permease